MLAIDRRRKIINILEEKGSVLVPQLSKEFSVTEETVRRDLEKLEKDGLLKRTYGGAVISDNINIDVPLNIREVTNIEGKKAIGIKVQEYIEDGDTIILDSSSTALQIASKLKNKRRITVITNSVKVILELADAKDCKVISTGGILRENAMSFVGPMTEEAISKYNVDKAIVSSKGIHDIKQITESNELEAEVKKTMVSVANKVYLVVDNAKFNKIAFTKMMNINKIDIVFTDKVLSAEWEQFFKNNNIELVYC